MFIPVSKFKAFRLVWLKLGLVVAAQAVLEVLIIIVLVSLLPAKIGQLSISAALSAVRNGFEARLPFIMAIIVLGLLLPVVRGTLRALLDGLTNRQIARLTISGSLFMLVALAHPRPVLLAYIGGFCLLLVAAWWASKLRLKSPTAPTEGYLLPDAILTDVADLAKDQAVILNQLEAIITKEPAIRSIGVYGDWGSGKTSIVNLCRHRLQVTQPDIIWAEFKPWKYTSQEALTLGFYETIGKALEDNIDGAQFSAPALLTLAAPLVKQHDKSGIFNFAAELVRSAYDRRQKHIETYINDLLGRESKRLVLVVDDVERLYEPDHIYRTLQLVHLLKNAQRVAYIFIAEKSILMQSVPSHHAGRQASYIEKFIEYELYVPRPQTNDLKAYLNRLTNEKKSLFPIDDIKLNLSRKHIAAMESYRGVNRLFNQFAFDLKERFYDGSDYTINLEDKFTLDLLAIKYPSVWAHINNIYNRSLYAGQFGQNVWQITNKEAAVKRDQDTLQIVIESAATDLTHQNYIQETLEALFPRVKHLLRHPERGAVPYEEWQRDKRVAHPYILDLYFASSTPQEEYRQNVKEVAMLLHQLSTADRRTQFSLFDEFLELYDQNRLTLFRQELLKTVSDVVKRRQYMGALWQAYLGQSEYLFDDEGNRSQLARIVSTIDESGHALVGQQDVLDDYYDYIFKGFSAQRPHPSVMLCLALYILPERDNHFYGIEKWQGYEQLRQQILDYTDKYYFKNRPKYNIYNESTDDGWRFVFYQWALSIRTNSSHAYPPGSEVRKQRVNDYALGILRKDTQLAYRIMQAEFWGSNWKDEPVMWRVNNEKLLPYDKYQIYDLVRSLTKASTLTKDKQHDMQALAEAIEPYISSHFDKDTIIDL